MSYFLIVGGDAPGPPDDAGFRLVPIDAAQPYLAEPAATLLPGVPLSSIRAVEDGTLTSSLVLETTADEVRAGQPLASTRFGAWLEEAVSAGCPIHAWWAGDAGPPSLDAFDEAGEFLREFATRLKAGVDLNCSFVGG